MYENRWVQLAFIIFLILVFFGLVLWGWSNGGKAAKSDEIIKDSQSITKGFEYFYKDQNRFPTTGEFTDDNLMRGYISNFPPQNFPSPECEKSFDYFSKDPQSYDLRICLPKAAKGFQKGWNSIKN